MYFIGQKWSTINEQLYASVENDDKMNALAGLRNEPDVFNINVNFKDTAEF